MTCPICGRKTLPAWRPFCSKRCADVDLAKWIRGNYAIPGEAADEDDLPESEDQPTPKNWQ